MPPRRGRKIAIAAGALALVVLGAATWLCWPHLRFWWLFQPLGPNTQGYPEYRHPATGIVIAARGDESREQQLSELHPQDLRDVINAAEYDGVTSFSYRISTGRSAARTSPNKGLEQPGFLAPGSNPCR